MLTWSDTGSACIVLPCGKAAGNVPIVVATPLAGSMRYKRVALAPSRSPVEGRASIATIESPLARFLIVVEVRNVFKISKVGAVAGCFVTQGTIERAAKVRLIREGREVYKGAIDALKRFKEDVKEVPQNFECGIKIGNFDDVKVGDVIEAYRVAVIRRTL